MACCFVFFFKQKTAYEMRSRDWSSGVCSSDLVEQAQHPGRVEAETVIAVQHTAERVGREHVGQRGGRGDKGSEPFPARPGGDYPVQGRAIVLRSKQSTTDFGKGLQRVPNGRLFI